ncbi:MAG: hypothetical protein CL811_04740 [Colwelliaceae bacterium]|nr:hypothetical protein [Colwelliaceae bacterium]|tara:strand:+ start:8402 stop:8794 length:393 start_codon:yes stop_codon:yes gene_type:complete
MKPKVLCVCAKGINRSRYLAHYLREKGYETRWGGVEPQLWFGKDITLYTKKEDIDWADVIVIVRPRLKTILEGKFPLDGKNVIVFDITDNPDIIVKTHPELEGQPKKVFNEKITYPALRNAIDPYLPLEK